MFEWKQKASNAILLDDNVGGKGKCFRAKFLQPGLVKYSFGVCLLDKMTIDRFVYQFEGCPVIIDHKDVTTESAKDDRVGVISKVWFNECDSWYWCEGVIFDQEALNLIDKGFNVSCQYEITEYSENRENKLHNGNEYDKTILNGRPEHLAIVQNPRYENAMIAVNALDLTAENEDKWITIKPNGEEGKGKHLLLKDGETPKEAIERTYGNKNKTSEDLRKEFRKYQDEIFDKHKSGTLTKEEHEEYLKKSEEFNDLYKKATTKENNKAYKEIVKMKETSSIPKISPTEKPGDKPKEHPNYNPKKKQGDDDFEKIFRPMVEPKKDESKSIKLNETIQGKTKKIQSVVKEVAEKTDINLSDYIGYAEERDWSKKDRLYIDYDKLEKDWKRKNNGINYRDALYWLGKRTNSEYNGGMGTFVTIKKETAKNDIIQAINEIKETDMFKNLFGKKEKKMEKDEIKAIFLECLTELKASNEAEKEEEKKDAANEEDKKEDKEAENKCKNADEPDYKKLYEELKAKMEAANEEEEKKEEKEAENKKAKNAIDEQLSKFCKEIEAGKTDYVSKAKAIELGNELF